MMKSSGKFHCSVCGTDSVVKEKKLYDDDFKLIGVRYQCAVCGAEVTPEEKKRSGSGNSIDKLAALLGEAPAARPRFEPEADDGHFCLHCRHFIKHPFKSLCGVTLDRVQATDGCEKFENNPDE